MPRGRPIRDLTAKTFGLLTVIEKSHKEGDTYYWKCQCFCGTQVIRPGGTITTGRSACDVCKIPVGRPAKGLPDERLSRILKRSWTGMIRRCKDPRCESYPNYGGRGITVCSEWKQFASFRKDMAPSWFPGAVIERKNNDGNYNKQNCVWIFPEQQAHNRVNTITGVVDGREMTILQAIQHFNGVAHYNLVKKRLQSGWTLEKAASVPPYQHLQWHTLHPEHEKLIEEVRALYQKKLRFIGISKKKLAVMGKCKYGTVLTILNNKVSISEMEGVKRLLEASKKHIEHIQTVLSQ